MECAKDIIHEFGGKVRKGETADNKVVGRFGVESLDRAFKDPDLVDSAVPSGVGPLEPCSKVLDKRGVELGEGEGILGAEMSQNLVGDGPGSWSSFQNA